MPIDINNATISDGKKVVRSKAPVGEHLCVVKDLRVLDGYKGQGFWADFVVKSGPAPEGFEFSWGIYPDNARPSGRITVEQLRNKEKGKIITIIAAVLGYEGEKIYLVTQPVFEYATKRPVSPFAGRLVTVHCRPWVNGKGEETSFYEIEPASPFDQEPFDLSKLSLPAQSVAAPPPPPPSAPWAPPAGWAPHPSGNGWYYNGSLVKHQSDLGG